MPRTSTLTAAVRELCMLGYQRLFLAKKDFFDERTLVVAFECSFLFYKKALKVTVSADVLTCPEAKAERVILKE